MPRIPNRLTLSLHNSLIYELRKKAGELGISVSALAASYIEKGLSDESTARMNEQLASLLDRLEAAMAQKQGAVSPQRLEAFMLESILLQRAALGSDVRKQGDVAAKVRQKLGLTFLDGQ